VRRTAHNRHLRTAERVLLRRHLRVFLLPRLRTDVGRAAL